MRRGLAWLVAAGLVFAMTGCGQSSSRANAWCRLVKKHNEVFATTKPRDAKALAAFEQIAAQAPPAIRADLLTISSYSLHVAHGEVAYLLPPKVNQFVTAKNHVDKYLRTECGVTLPSKPATA